MEAMVCYPTMAKPYQAVRLQNGNAGDMVRWVAAVNDDQTLPPRPLQRATVRGGDRGGSRGGSVLLIIEPREGQTGMRSTSVIAPGEWLLYETSTGMFCGIDDDALRRLFHFTPDTVQVGAS